MEKGVEGMELLVCRNPKAAKQFEIEERIEAGMVLKGSEVKSLRNRRGDLEGAFAQIHGDEVYLQRMHIAPYEQGGPHFNHEPKRRRKLLLHRHEIERMRGRLTTKGYTLVPLQVYFKGGHAKVQLGLAKGRKVKDNREAIRRAQDLKEAREAASRRRS
ncbi:MAG: SsrA-binding protein SmpB [Myxococcota bacterium]